MPKVSIILPCYNVEKYLSRSIQSVLNQTFSNFELLVIIDGSPDNSKSIAESYTDPRVKVFEKENGGLSDARNYGLDRAKGEYIYFMDSDDWIESDLLADNLAILEEENIDLVIFGYMQDDENSDGNIISSTPVLPKLAKLMKGNTSISLDGYHLGLLGYAWNKIYRKSFIDQHYFRFEKGISLVEDVLFNFRVYEATVILRFNSKAYYHYLNRPVVTLMKKYYENALDLIILRTNAITNFLLKWELPEKETNQIVSSSYLNGIRYVIDNLISSDNYNSVCLDRVLNHQLTQKLIVYYQPNSMKDRIYKILILNKCKKLIEVLNRFK